MSYLKDFYLGIGRIKTDTVSRLGAVARYLSKTSEFDALGQMQHDGPGGQIKLMA
jgi:hypothetical protein